MKNLITVFGAGLLLTACGQYALQPTVDVGTSVNDVDSQLTLEKTVTTKDATTTTTWKTVSSGPAKFVFQSRPGSQAAYITGFRVIRDVIDGTEVPVASSAGAKVNIYVPSGFTCAGASATQSCDLTDPTTVAANGFPSVELSLGLAADLGDEIIAKNASVSRSVDIVFSGQSATGKPVEILVTGVVAQGNKTGAP